MPLGTPEVQGKKPPNRGNFLTKKDSMVGCLSLSCLFFWFSDFSDWSFFWQLFFLSLARGTTMRFLKGSRTQSGTVPTKKSGTPQFGNPPGLPSLKITIPDSRNRVISESRQWNAILRFQRAMEIASNLRFRITRVKEIRLAARILMIWL